MSSFVIGALGAARIAHKALVEPARLLGVEVVVAARDESRARAFASEHGLAGVASDYEALLEDPKVDAVYIALPAALHAEWSERALRAGKHVLVEKPATLSESSARCLVDLADEKGLFLLEAHHSDFHPLRAVFDETLAELGMVWHVDAWFDAPIAASDIRRMVALGAGALTDFGCYLVRWLAWLGLGWPSIERARVRVAEPEVDEAFFARGHFEAGASYVLSCDMHRSAPFRAGIAVTGEGGRLVFDNPLALGGSVVRVGLSGRRVEIPAEPQGPTTYLRQLEAFVDGARGGVRRGVFGEELVRTQRMLERLYSASGLAPRAALAQTAPGRTGPKLTD